MRNELVPKNPILLVDDEEDFLKSMKFGLNSHGFNNVITCQKSSEVMYILQERKVSMIFLDLLMPDISGEELLPRIAAKYPGTPINILTAFSEVERVVKCMKNGAFDYLTKPVETEELVSKVRQTLSFIENKKKAEQLKHCYLSDELKHPEAFAKIATSNHQMKKLFRYVEAIADSDAPVLISGETGVGKDLFAKAVHRISGRKGEFHPLKIGGIDANSQSEMIFGAIKKDDNGISQFSKGLADKANEGTLFLDEFENLSEQFQISLFDLIAKGTFYVNGLSEPRKTNTRIIVATNSDINDAVNKGLIRNDLFQRINIHHIRIPPLRERTEDIPLLVRFYVEMSSEKLKTDIPYIPKELFMLLENYHFPGNVGELAWMTYEAVKLTNSSILNVTVFEEKITERGGIIGAGSGFEKKINTAGYSAEVDFGHPFPIFNDLERLYFDEALTRSNNIKSKAARITGLKYKNFLHRMRKIYKKGNEKVS